jgi:hypothetical protein
MFVEQISEIGCDLVVGSVADLDDSVPETLQKPRRHGGKHLLRLERLVGIL